MCLQILDRLLNFGVTNILYSPLVFPFGITFVRVIFILLLSAKVFIREVLLLGLLLLVIDWAFVVLRSVILLNIEDVLVHLQWLGGPFADGLVEAIEAAWHLLLA